MTRSRDVADTQDNLGGAVAPFVAGKNKIINGDFGIWQRGTSITPTRQTDNYLADRWICYWDGVSGTTTFSQQTFTPGTAPVAGYESNFYLRGVFSSTATFGAISQRVEDVRNFAGQTATISFWARATSSVTVTPLLRQLFGTGGSTLVDNYAASGLTIGTSWARYSVAIPVLSVAGKTIGAGSSVQAYPIVYTSGTIASNTIDIWGVQVEAGSVATPFQTAAGSIGGELALCQRYYYNFANGADKPIGVGFYNGTTNAQTVVKLPVTMRTNPTLVATSGTSYYQLTTVGVDDPFNSLTIFNVSTESVHLYNNTEASGTSGTAGQLKTINAAASAAFSAEL